LRLSSAAGYALSAVTYMAHSKENGPIASHVVAAAREIPERFLLKVLKPLVSARILSSIKGPNGGYRLTRTPKQLSLLDIVEAVDGPIRGVVPRLDGDSSAKLDRSLENVCKDAARVVRAHLSRIKVSTLLGK
jgi:Rrf2 family transcriptional regulator, cysteine metabolism repressor